MAADRLGRAVERQVAAQRQWPLPDRRGDRVVERHLAAVRLAERRGGGDVEHHERRVDRRLEVQQARRRRERRLPPLGTARVHERVRPAEALGAPLEQRLRTAVARIDAHHVVARAQQCEERARDRGHARGEQQRGLRALEAAMRIDLVQNLGNRPAAPGLDRADGRVALALVERSCRALVLRTHHVVERSEGEGRAVHDRRAHLAHVLGVRAVDGGRFQRGLAAGRVLGHRRLQVRWRARTAVRYGAAHCNHVGVPSAQAGRTAARWR